MKTRRFLLRAGLKILFCLFAVSVCGVCFAGNTETVVIKTDIPQQSSLTITISRVTDNVWTTVNGLEFGRLTYDEENKIFKANFYYAVDVGINCNSPDWRVTHLATSITNGIESLDKNINVSFVNQLDDNNGIEIVKLNYADSSGKAFTKSQFSEKGWLRIYYGIATGDDKDAPGTTPIVASGSGSGAYKGSINITLTS